MTRQQKNFWPASLQILLFRATFLSDEAGLKSWEGWRSQVNMDDYPDPGSFRLLSQLYHNLKQMGVDDPLRMKFKGIARQMWYKNQRFFQSLVSPLRILNEAGIESMLLYGSGIALNYYPDYALGSEANSAILVPTKQAGQSINLLQASGWQPERRLPDVLTEPYFATGWMHFFRDATGRRIHLHWHLLPECREAEAEADFWCGAVATKVHDVPVRILNPADQILHSCVENISTSEPSLFLRAIDVMLIIKAVPDLDWDRLITQAEKHRLVVPLLAVLRFIQDNLDEPLPPAIWQRLQSLPISRQEHLEYKLKTSRPVIWRRFWRLWFNYLRRSSEPHLMQSIIGFPRFLQHFWRLEHLWQVPLRAVSAARSRLRWTI